MSNASTSDHATGAHEWMTDLCAGQSLSKHDLRYSVRLNEAIEDFEYDRKDVSVRAPAFVPVMILSSVDSLTAGRISQYV